MSNLIKTLWGRLTGIVKTPELTRPELESLLL